MLIINFPEEQTITADSMKAICFPRGYYAYFGSAMGGFKARLNYHLKSNKKPYWCIDSLLEKATVSEMVLYETVNKAECAVAQILNQQILSVALALVIVSAAAVSFFTTDKLKPTIMATYSSLSMQPRLVPRGRLIK
jgi:hypothetical protein